MSLKLAPWFGLAQTSNDPPCSKVSSSEIAKPSPVPPLVRFLAGSARQNRSKTRSSSLSLMPTPWSVTRTATASLLTPTATVMGLPSPCSIALASKFPIRRSILLESNSATTSPSGNSSVNSLPRFLAKGSMDETAEVTTWVRS